MQVRLADVRVARRLEPPDRLGRPRRDVLGEQDRPVGRRQALGVEEVLDRQRDAVADGLGPREEDPGGRIRQLSSAL
jgi:hypothetical protein